MIKNIYFKYTTAIFVHVPLHLCFRAFIRLMYDDIDGGRLNESASLMARCIGLGLPMITLYFSPLDPNSIIFNISKTFKRTHWTCLGLTMINIYFIRIYEECTFYTYTSNEIKLI